MTHMAEEMKKLTEQLVSIGSVNGTFGEKEVALFIEGYLREIPYFKEHPQQVIIQPLEKDTLNRRNVFALVKGEKNHTEETIIFHGHMDTVGIEDYGGLKAYAWNPKELKEKMLAMELPEEVRRDLESDDWMCGRGACDMKSGVAVFMVLLKYFSKHVEELSGNILLSVNPVEENLHTGIIEGRKVLEELQEKENLHYILAINNDYTCPLYEGDTNHYLYTGAVGKLLPCFYVQGKETHVGQCFEGFDASVAAAKLAERISLNTEFCDVYEGESTLPPSVLKLKDLKDFYNVQTAFSALVYFNYFVHNASMESIVAKLKQAGEEVFAEMENSMNEQYTKYCKISKTAGKEVHYHKKVYTYEELYQAVTEKKSKIEKSKVIEDIEELTKQEEEKGTDKREIPVAIIRYLLEALGEKPPVMVLYFAAPYCPHNTLKQEVEEERKLYETIRKIAGDGYKILQFFPSLSDSSYLKIDDKMSGVELLLSNFPAYHKLYPVPLKEIKKLNIPAVNYGVYGKDAHKWTERVYMPYSFETLPKLIIKTVEHFLESEEKICL